MDVQSYIKKRAKTWEQELLEWDRFTPEIEAYISHQVNEIFLLLSRVLGMPVKSRDPRHREVSLEQLVNLSHASIVEPGGR